MLSFRSSGSSKECMVMWRVREGTQLVFRQEPGEGHRLCGDTNLRFLLSYTVKLEAAEE